jgi:hypothetical protein
LYLEREFLRRLLRLYEVVTVGPKTNRICVFRRRKIDASYTCTQRKDHVKTQQESSRLQAKKRAIKAAKTLVLDFQYPEL